MSAPDRVMGELWEHALSFLPEDLDLLARQTGSVRRTRQVENSSQLLRALLLYAHLGSFRTAAAMAKASGLLSITAEGLFYRLKHSEKFLEALLLSLASSLRAPVGYRLVVVDATAVCGPASTGTDWRVHVGYDPARGVPCSIHVTDASVGEALSHHGLQPGYLVVADRAYGTARNVHAAVQAGADVLVRVQKKQMRLLQEDGRRVDWDVLDRQVPAAGAVSFSLLMPVPPEGKSAGAAWREKDAIAWHKVRLTAARSARGEAVWLLTNLSEERLPCATAAELYRVRWQVELYFKRLKSLGDLDVLNSRDGPTARAALLAKLVLLVLAGLLSEQEEAFSPYGYPVRQWRPQPVARIRLRPEAAHRRTAAKRPSPKGAQRSAQVLQA